MDTDPGRFSGKGGGNVAVNHVVLRDLDSVHAESPPRPAWGALSTDPLQYRHVCNGMACGFAPFSI